MFRSDSVRQRPVLLAMALLIAACGTTPTEAVTDGVRFRLLNVNVSQPADADVLSLRGELTNTRRTPLVSGGCLRPTLAIDSATATGWAPVETRQLEPLIFCIRAFTVDPGATVGFEADLYPAGAGRFPRTARLRLRVVEDPPGIGAVVPLTLP